ncbi:MAG: hypothetical protein ACREJ9_13370 [Candidatus Rokuibacteriota bacterium]
MGQKSRAKLERRGRGAPEPARPRSGWKQWSRWVVGGVGAVLLVAGGLGAWQQWNGGRLAFPFAAATPQPAPRFNLMAASGPVITLDDYVGKQEVVLIFYMGAG